MTGRLKWPTIEEKRGLLADLVDRRLNALWLISPSIENKLPDGLINSRFAVSEANVSTLIEVQEKIAEMHPSTIIAVGGGKVLDVAKLAAKTVQPDEHTLWQDKNILNTLRRSAPLNLIAVPSTAGSGSESSETAVLTVEGVKMPLHADFLLPDLIFLDSDLLKDTPDRVLWNGLWDTLVHSLESALSPIANVQTRAHSYEAFRSTKGLIDQHLALRGFLNFNVTSAQWNSLRAGKAQSLASAGLVHALAHQSEHADQWHGEACARLLPMVLRKNAEKAADKLSSFALTAGFDSFEELIRWTEDAVLQSCGRFIPRSAETSKKEDIIQNIVKDPCFRTNPAFWTRTELVTWLETWFYES